MNRQPDGRVVAVCISEKRGTKKQIIPCGILEENRGIEGDAHSGSDSIRQVSLLATESIQKMEKKGLQPIPGLFAENIVTSGIDLKNLKPGTKLSIGKTAVLEITQIGKECHAHCEVYLQVGDCIMPKEGVFARVIQGGTVKEGDWILLIDHAN